MQDDANDAINDDQSTRQSQGQRGKKTTRQTIGNVVGYVENQRKDGWYFFFNFANPGGKENLLSVKQRCP